jgi:hypothetical protein
MARSGSAGDDSGGAGISGVSYRDGVGQVRDGCWRHARRGRGFAGRREDPPPLDRHCLVRTRRMDTRGAGGGPGAPLLLRSAAARGGSRRLWRGRNGGDPQRASRTRYRGGGRGFAICSEHGITPHPSLPLKGGGGFFFYSLPPWGRAIAYRFTTEARRTRRISIRRAKRAILPFSVISVPPW